MLQGVVDTSRTESILRSGLAPPPVNKTGPSWPRFVCLAGVMAEKPPGLSRGRRSRPTRRAANGVSERPLDGLARRASQSRLLRQTFIDDKGLPSGRPFRHSLVILSSQKIAEKCARLPGAVPGTGKLMILEEMLRKSNHACWTSSRRGDVSGWTNQRAPTATRASIGTFHMSR